jgi:hypothetical protein
VCACLCCCAKLFVCASTAAVGNEEVWYHSFWVRSLINNGMTKTVNSRVGSVFVCGSVNFIAG